jgi:hypothetical protein
MDQARFWRPLSLPLLAQAEEAVVPVLALLELLVERPQAQP